MATKLYYNPFVPAFSNTGVAVPNAYLYFYNTGTSVLANIFSDSAATVPLNNPVQADGSGKYVDIYLDAATTYRVKQTYSNGAPLGDDVDPYIPGTALKGDTGDVTPELTALVGTATTAATTATTQASIATTAATTATTQASIATTKATDSANSATTSSNAAATAVAARDAAIATLGSAAVFLTKANANAGIATVAADAFIRVHQDETHGNEAWLYQKVSGAYVSRGSAIDWGAIRIFRPQDYGAATDTVITPSGAWTIGTDCADAIDATFAAMKAAKGGKMLLTHAFATSRNHLIPNNGDPNGVTPNTDGGVPTQYTYVIESANGAFSAGQQDNQAPAGVGALVWTGGAAGDTFVPARLTTHGRGLLQIQNANLISAASDTNARPFVFTSNTTVWMRGTCVWSPRSYENCGDDIIQCGGRTIVFGQRKDSPFQGYGTIIDGNYFNGVRAIDLRTYANKIIVSNNNFWARCGSNVANGSAIIVDGYATDTPNQYATGAIITNNLIECPGYGRPIYLGLASAAFLAGNDSYDEDTTGLNQAQCCIYVDTNALDITIAGKGVTPDARPYVAGPGNTNNRVAILSSYGPEPAQLGALKAGLAGYPNQLADTTFTRPGTLIMQPSDPSSGTGNYVQFLKPVADATSPGATIWRMTGNGQQFYGDANSAQSGNVSVTAAGQAEYWSQGKQWGFNGRSGGAMGHNTGTGGSTYTAQQFSFIWRDHTGAILGRLGNHMGGVGATGIAFGAAYDVELFRHSATVVRCNVKLTANSGIGVGNSAPATTLGTLSRKMEVFDATGASIGFVPIYTSIT